MTACKPNNFWISLEEAQQRSPGLARWWALSSVDGSFVSTEQQHPLGPKNLPVRVYSNGNMYLGGWENGGWAGLGVLLTQRGQVLIGSCIKNAFAGVCKQVWLPESPCWKRNKDKKSPIVSWEFYSKNTDRRTNLPFIYIGNMQGLIQDDEFARVILKDGTTRWGAWKHGRPVGDWWMEHCERYTKCKDINDLMRFGDFRFSMVRSESIFQIEPEDQDFSETLSEIEAALQAEADASITTSNNNSSNEKLGPFSPVRSSPSRVKMSLDAVMEGTINLDESSSDESDDGKKSPKSKKKPKREPGKRNLLRFCSSSKLPKSEIAKLDSHASSEDSFAEESEVGNLEAVRAAMKALDDERPELEPMSSCSSSSMYNDRLDENKTPRRSGTRLSFLQRLSLRRRANNSS